MTTATKTELTWKNIDPSSLPGEHGKLFAAYKTAYKLAAAAREAFEAKMRADARLPEGKTLVFGYRFGQLGIAIGNSDKPKSAKSATLQDFLEAAKTA